MKTYEQKNLGYERCKTDAKISVEFDNGETWEVPLQIVADSRDAAYKDEEEDTVKFVREGGLTAFEFTDWFHNNMNWSDFSAYAVLREKEPVVFDYEGDFCNCDSEVVGDV